MAESEIPGRMTEKQRNKRIRERIVDMYRQFVSEVDPKNVLDLLIEKRVISLHQKQEITNKVTVIDRCRALLDHLFSCSNDRSFIVLREALEDQYHWIVERIDRCETENETVNYLDAKCSQSKMTKTEHQEHPADPGHVNLQVDVEERLKKALESMKSSFEIGNKKLEQKLEDSRRDISKIKELYEESRKETAEMKDQYCIIKDDFDKALLRESNLRKELHEIKSCAKSGIGGKIIFGNAQEALNTTLKSNEPLQNSPASSSESTKECNRCAVFIANWEAAAIVNLNRPDDVTAIEPLPDQFQIGAVAAVYRNSIFVCGVGSANKDIWRLDSTSSKWRKCASLIKGRLCHSVAFVGHVLYICGGWVDSWKALDDVETYNAFDDRCSEVGNLTYAVFSSGNCVQVKASLYIFGGLDAQGKDVSNVQVYNTMLNTCTLLTKQMPRACSWLRGELWKNYVILFGKDGCFIYDIDTHTWKVRDKFKLENVYYGVTVNDDKLFVIGCGACKDDVRWIPVADILNDDKTESRYHAKIPNTYRLIGFSYAKL